MHKPPQSNLELSHLVPTVVSDGNVVFISNDGDVPTISFFQVRGQVDSRVKADVVASVRMTSIEDLKALHASISETIQNHEARER